MMNFQRNNDIAVMMTVYYGDNVTYFKKAVKSILNNNIDLFIFCDGKVKNDIDEFLLEISSSKNIFIFYRNTNLGLAISLNELLSKILQLDYMFIARMDSDDICMSDRLCLQREFLENNPDIDVVGCWISEIDENDQIIKDEVRYPLDHNSLFKFFSKRDPIAHPTAMFRKSFFNKAGLYSSEVHLAEDTLLWYSAFMNNCRFANIPYVGLQFRRTSNFYLRRANWEKSWGLLRFRLYKINRALGYGIKSDLYAIAYFIISISPSFIKKFLYNKFR